MARKPPLIPPPTTDPDEPPFVCPEINKSWIPYIIGALRPMKYPEYWAGTLDENRTARKNVANLINQLAIAGECGVDDCCPDVPSVVTVLHQIGSDGSSLEMSVDGGVTWHPDNTDPRGQIMGTPPIVPNSSATVCDAAANIVQGLMEAQTLISNTASGEGTLQEIALEVITAILGFLLLPPVGALVLLTLVVGLVKHFLALGKDNYDALFTAENWDIVRCAFSCSLEEDGHLTAEGMSEAKRYIYRHVSGNNSPTGAAQNIVDVINFVGLAGLNLVAYTYQSSGANCDDCECDDCTLDIDFRTQPFNWLLNDFKGTWVNGQGWKSTKVTTVEGQTTYYSEVTYLFHDPCTAAALRLEWFMDNNSGNRNRAYFHELRKVGGELVWNTGYNISPNPGAHIETFTFGGIDDPIYGWRFGVLKFEVPANHYIQHVEIGDSF